MECADAWKIAIRFFSGIQSVFLADGTSPLPIFFVNTIPVCQASLGAIDQIRALKDLLAEALGRKVVDIKIDVNFGNTTCYLQALEILKVNLI